MNESFSELAALASEAETNHPYFTNLLPPIFTSQGSWKKERVLPEDLKGYGNFDYVKEMGPLTWQPFSAPALELPRAQVDGTIEELFRLNDLTRNRKHALVIFHLGDGCEQCVAQLDSFEKKYQEFTNLNLEIISVNLNPAENIKGKNPRYVHLADPKASAFKEWGVFDDFDNKVGGLHGTFLVVAGKIVWRDISSTPFNDVEFLLKEAKRLSSTVNEIN